MRFETAPWLLLSASVLGGPTLSLLTKRVNFLNTSFRTKIVFSPKIFPKQLFSKLWIFIRIEVLKSPFRSPPVKHRERKRETGHFYLTAQTSVSIVFCGSYLPFAFHLVCDKAEAFYLSAWARYWYKKRYYLLEDLF